MYSKINFLKILNFVLIVKSCKTKSWVCKGFLYQ